MTKEQVIAINKSKLYEIQVGGISCTNCAKKIKLGLGNKEGVNKVSVNVLAEKVQVAIDEAATTIQSIQDSLIELKFQVLHAPIEINMEQSDSKRQCYFEISAGTSSSTSTEKQSIGQNVIESLSRQMKEISGVTDCQVQELNILKITYNPLVIKSSQIYEQLKKNDKITVEVRDIYLDQFKKKQKKFDGVGVSDLILALILVLVYVIFVLIIPQFDFFDSTYIYPFEMDVVSIYMLVVFLLTLFVILKYGISTFKQAYRSFAQFRIMNMETLITIGSLSAFFMGVFLTIMYIIENQQNDDLSQGNPSKKEKNERREQVELIVHMFESAALILLVVLLGKFLEGKAKGTITQMTENLFKEEDLLTNKTAMYLEPKNRKFDIENEIEYEISLIEKGDLIKLVPGQKLLVDGVILKIENDLKAIDSVCYGWDEPFSVKLGDRLKSGATIAQGGGIMQIEATVENSMLYKISNQLNVAQNDQESNETGIQALFKTISDYFVKIIILVAFLVLIIWIILIAADAVEVHDYCVYCVPFMRFISVLVASCPCALGLAIPSVIMITLNLAMNNNILIKKNTIFDKILNTQSVIFDKTGTLFTKVDKVTEYRLAPHIKDSGYEENDIWEIICLIEKQSRHPIAELLYKESLSHITNSLNLSYVVEGPIQFKKNGLKASLKHKKNSEKVIPFLIGNKSLMQDNEVEIDEESQKYLDEQSKKGQTCLLMALENRIAFQISLDNTANLREEAPAVVTYLQRELKKDVYILSGDAKETVRRVGIHLNIPEENLIGETDAESKKELIKSLKQKTGKEVMMIGDGLNDILSIQEAGIGVTINAKSEMNLLASDVVALNENLWKIVSLFKLIKYSKIFIYVNLFWASLYNIIMLPLAAGVFFSLNFEISPTVASASMSGSSLFVVLFSNLMRGIEFDQSKTRIGKKYVKQFQIDQRFNDEYCRKQNLINELNIKQ